MNSQDQTQQKSILQNRKEKNVRLDQYGEILREGATSIDELEIKKCTNKKLNIKMYTGPRSVCSTTKEGKFPQKIIPL